jgi:hypothetical protein
MEFLLINYPWERGVVIDGVEAGLTNHLITLAAGTYTVSLVPPEDFFPADQDVVVKGTSPLRPREVEFD